MFFNVSGTELSFGEAVLAIERTPLTFGIGFVQEELIPAVARHFAEQVVEENETLLSFAYFLKKQQNFVTSNMAQHRIPRTAAK